MRGEKLGVRWGGSGRGRVRECGCLGGGCLGGGIGGFFLQKAELGGVFAAVEGFCQANLPGQSYLT